MLFNEVTPSSVLPGKKVELIYSIAQIKDIFLDILSKKGRSYYEIFNRNTIKTPNPLKSLLINLEEHLKAKCLDDDQKIVLKQVFDTIRNQFNLLEHIKLKETKSDEVVTVLLAVAISHLENLIVD